MSYYNLDIRPGSGNGAALLLPGMQYGLDRPLFTALIPALEDRGMTLGRVGFSYAADHVFATWGDDAQLARIAEDGRAILADMLEVTADSPLLLIGKSLGTIAMGAMLGRDLPARVGFAWLTPSLKGTDLLVQMQTGLRNPPGPSFSLIGGRDPSVDVTRGAGYLGLPGMTHLEVGGMNHAWEHEAGADQMQGVADHCAQAFTLWLDRLGWVDGLRHTPN